MKRILSVLSVLFGLLTAAAGQVVPFPQSLPPNTVVGRTGISSGPAQAIPFSVLSSNLGITANVKSFGAVGDCVTNDYTAIVNAIASLAPSGGTVVFPRTVSNCYAFTTALDIGNGTSTAASTVSNIKFVGDGLGSPTAGEVTPTITGITLKYTGATPSVGYALRFSGPGTFGMENIDVNAGGMAFGIWMRHVFKGSFDHVSVTNFVTVGIRQEAYPALPTGVFIGSCDNQFRNITIDQQGVLNVRGVDIGFDTAGGGNFDVCRDVWNGLQILMPADTGSCGLVLRGADLLSFINPFIFSVGGVAKGVCVIAPTGFTQLPSAISFYNAAIVGQISTPTDLSWRPDLNLGQGLNFHPLATGDAVAAGISPPVNNTVGGLKGVTTDGRPIGGVVDARTTTTETIKVFDVGQLITFNNAGATAVTLPQATLLGPFGTGWFVDVENIGAGLVTITPTTSTIDGGANISLAQTQGARIFSDGTNFFTQRGQGVRSVPTPLSLNAANSAITWSGMSSDGILVASSATAVVTNRCTVDSNNSLSCVSAGSNLPQFNLTNTTADAQAAYFIFNKNRTGGNSLNGDKLGEVLFGGFANAANRFAAQVRAQQTAASSGSNIPSSISLSTSNTAGLLNQTLAFDQNAHFGVTAQSTAPTITAGCNGAGSSITGGTGGARDVHATVTGQTAAATTCTITFGTAFANTPDCTGQGISSPLTGAFTPATGTLVVNFASTANYKFTFHCYGN